MNLRALYSELEDLPLVGSILQRLQYPLKFMLFHVFERKSRKHWADRTDTVMDCPDNQFIPRVPQAGKIVAGYQIMHNGIKIIPGSYYGEGMRLLLKRNRGVHEPQEERVFMEVLKQMPKEALIVELGAYWGFYSMWFHKEVQKPTCYLVEPVWGGLLHGQRNFAINGMAGEFVQAYAGRATSEAADGVRTVCIDDFVAEHDIKRINILHADIQTAELDMLRGAQRSLEANLVDYVVISTHTDELHSQCLSFLAEHGFRIISEANCSESYSVDGVIVACRTTIQEVGPIPISRRTER